LQGPTEVPHAPARWLRRRRRLEAHPKIPERQVGAQQAKRDQPQLAARLQCLACIDRQLQPSGSHPAFERGHRTEAQVGGQRIAQGLQRHIELAHLDARQHGSRARGPKKQPREIDAHRALRARVTRTPCERQWQLQRIRCRLQPPSEFAGAAAADREARTSTGP